MASAGDPDDDPDEPESIPAGESTPDGMTTNLEGMLAFLSAKYCPHCGTRRPVDEMVCPTDGTALRDLSITTGCGWGSTAFSLSATGASRTSLAGLIEGQAAPAHPEDDFHITGVVLGGKWRVEKLVAEGTFGAFFLGRHVTLGMQVGIKILRRRFTHSEAGLRLFHNEAMRLSLLHHPAIVQVLDYGEESDRPYLVMEYLTGTPLNRFLTEKSFTVDDGVEVIRQAAEALIAAHKGVGIGEPLVHLDLKPEHIFLERIQGRWHVKVIDFGIAEIAAAPSDPAVGEKASKNRKRLAGTLPYMAPERWDGAVDPRCDLYSLGIVLYELVAGRKPFDIWDAEAMRILHTREKPTPPSRHRLRSREPGLRDLDAIVLRLLEKDPARRPQSAEELAGTLERWQKRPKLTPRQRLVRACVMPAAIVVLALGLVAWGPWEGITINSPKAMVVGERSVDILAVVRGVGYDSAWLRVHHGDESKLVPLDEVKAGGCIAKELTITDFGGLSRTEVLEAELLATGPLGRKVELAGLKVRLDDTPPGIREINGNPPPSRDQPLLLLRGGEGKLQVRVRADEPLDPAKCTLNGVRAKEESTVEGRSDDALFELAKDATSFELVIVDPAGNRTKEPYAWKIKLGSDKAPRPLPPDVRRTHQTDYPLLLVWNEDPGPVVTVTVDGREQALKTVREKDSYWRARAHVAFDPGQAGREVTKRVRVHVAPEGIPAGDHEVEVRWLSRKLTVDREGGMDGNSLPMLYAKDGVGKRLAEDLQWELTIVWDGGGGRVDGWREGPTGPHLQLTDEHLRGKTSGKFQIQAAVIDAFENRSPLHLWSYARDVPDPTIGKFSLEDPALQTIHHESCRLSDSHQRLRLVYDVKYEHGPQSLSLKLWLETRGASRAEVPFDNSGDHRLEVSLARLRSLLKVGRNRLFLEVQDPDTRKPVEESCFLDYEAAPTAEIQPRPDEPVESDFVDVTVSPSRSDVTGVRVNGESAAARGQDFVARVSLSPAGGTPVSVEVTFEGGCVFKPPERRYSRVPRQGARYVLPLDAGRMPIELRYCEELRLWYTPLLAVAPFEAAEARAAKWRPSLEKFLTDRLGQGLKWELALPSPSEVQAISTIERRQGAGREWVAQPMRPSPDPAFKDLRACVERDREGRCKEDRWRGDLLLPYHLVLRNLDPRRGAELPRHATQSSELSGGKK